jgi:uncharacterized YigZ family protein
MITIDKIYTETYIINKSKFISYAYPVFDEDECKKYLENLRREYSDATHICFAYLLDSPKVEKCSDDGEPSGTAGKPILELIKKKKLSNILLVVIRYFGGIKLGAGGLVRAYTASGNMALDNANVIEVKDINKYSIKINYDDVNRVKNLIIAQGGEIKNIQYGEKAQLEFISENISNLSGFLVVNIGSEKICK